MSSPPPSFSFVIPTYNRYHKIRGCFQSIVDNIGDFRVEVIVVDDGSDQTEDLVCLFRETYPHIAFKYRKHADRLGLARSRNLAIMEAQSTHIVFLDSDNELLPGGLEEAAKFIREDRDILFLKNRYTSRAAKYPPHLDNNLMDFREYICAEPLQEYSCIIRRECIDMSTLFVERLWGFEGLFWMRLLLAGRTLFVADCYFQRYDNTGGDRLSNVTVGQSNNRAEGTYLMLNLYYKELKAYNRAYYYKLLYNLMIYRRLAGFSVDCASNFIGESKSKLLYGVIIAIMNHIPTRAFRFALQHRISLNKDN